jgi:hypothetical protein
VAGPAEGIGRVGFRRWYERQLIESHAWLVACVLAMILVASGVELLSLEDGWRDFVFDALLIGGGLALGWTAWMRYARTMLVAEFIGGQANCPSCAHYGFRLDRTRRTVTTFGARCPKCDFRWSIDQPPA